jgi:hypothetical protein
MDEFALSSTVGKGTTVTIEVPNRAH